MGKKERKTDKERSKSAANQHVWQGEMLKEEKDRHA